MQTTQIIDAVKQLTATDLERLLGERAAEDKALRALWRAAIAREREARKQKHQQGGGSGR